MVPWLEAGRGVARLEREGGWGGAQETGARLYFVIYSTQSVQYSQDVTHLGPEFLLQGGLVEVLPGGVGVGTGLPRPVPALTLLYTLLGRLTVSTALCPSNQNGTKMKILVDFVLFCLASSDELPLCPVQLYGEVVDPGAEHAAQVGGQEGDEAPEQAGLQQRGRAPARHQTKQPRRQVPGRVDRVSAIVAKRDPDSQDSQANENLIYIIGWCHTQSKSNAV